MNPTVIVPRDWLEEVTEHLSAAGEEKLLGCNLDCPDGKEYITCLECPKFRMEVDSE